MRLVLIRHAHPRAGYADDVDPGLDDLGREQAITMSALVAPIGPRPIIVSPLRRTRETAAVLEDAWDTSATVDPRVGEIPSPFGLADRSTWLGAVLRGKWSEQPDALRQWRDDLLDTLRALPSDTVVVTHFVAINAIVGAATGDDRVASCMPDYCSQTTVEADERGLTMVDLGAQASTRIR
ncbi:MAG: histidine phosphatase family protein [Actinobacteria bacterium]|nr:histidine phosphatase family protein [Actinomycetota bacterium]